MDIPESDPFALLREIDCPELRALTARKWGILDRAGDEAYLYCVGTGPNAQINVSILAERQIPAAKMSENFHSKADLSAKSGLTKVKHRDMPCPYCGRS